MSQQHPGSPDAEQELILHESPSASAYGEPVDRLAVAVSPNGIDLDVTTRASLVRSIEFGCTITFAGAMGYLSMKVCHSIGASTVISIGAFAAAALLTFAAGHHWFRFRV